MSQPKVLLYSSQSEARRAEHRLRGFVAVKEVGLWDLELILGDLPAMLAKIGRMPLINVHAVVAPVPIGVVAAGSQFEDDKPRLLAGELVPHAARVAEHLGLDELIAFTPWQLAAPNPMSHREGRVAIVSMEQHFAKRKRKPRNDAKIVELAFGLVPVLAGVIKKREIVPG
ncbi:MAG: hypothetical protein IT168_19985 [Bryobacterales bacterium]|nr:hypothetical protein [Bryobacterales bacterium]